MYYLCIENDQITSVSTVKPNTPESVLVVEVTEDSILWYVSNRLINMIKP